MAATLWSIALFLNNWLPEGFGGFNPYPFPWPGNLVGGAAVAAAAGLGLFLRGRPARQATLDLGLAFLVANAFALGLLDEWMAREVRVRSVSWIAVVILVCSMIAPSTPRKTLVASLVAASMDPLGALIAHLRGIPVPPAVEVLVQYWPNYAAALLAVVPSQVLQRLGRQIRRAREAGSYELVEALGHGGMGEVWRAEHRLLARPAAVKIVRPEVLAADGGDAQLIMRRFMREAQATAVLSSPHTIDLYDFGVTDEGSFYYVMELLVGRDLESLVRDFGPLPANRAVYLLRAGLPFAGRGPQPEPRPPRRQAGQHLRLSHGAGLRLRQGARLRPREVRGGRVGAANSEDGGPRHFRHAGLHGARGDPGVPRRTGGPTCTRSAASLTGC